MLDKEIATTQLSELQYNTYPNNINNEADNMVRN